MNIFNCQSLKEQETKKRLRFCALLVFKTEETSDALNKTPQKL